MAGPWSSTTTYIRYYIMYIMIPISSTTSMSSSTHIDDESSSGTTALQFGKQFHGNIYGITNTLITTAHIHDLLFQPGSGAYGSDGSYAPAASSSQTTSTLSTTLPPPSFRGTLTTVLTSSLPTLTTTSPPMPRSMSIVGIKASTYQDTLGVPFTNFWEQTTATPEGGVARHEAFRGGTLLYLLFSLWKWFHTTVIYTPPQAN